MAFEHKAEYKAEHDYRVDAQAIEHRSFQAEREFGERLAEYVLSHRAGLEAAWNESGPGGSTGRWESALAIIESGAFSLPRGWAPGQPFVMQGREGGQHTGCLIYNRAGQAIGKHCRCYDFARLRRTGRGFYCKHLIAGWLLGQAYLALTSTTNRKREGTRHDQSQQYQG